MKYKSEAPSFFKRITYIVALLSTVTIYSTYQDKNIRKFVLNIFNKYISNHFNNLIDLKIKKPTELISEIYLEMPISVKFTLIFITTLVLFMFFIKRRRRYLKKDFYSILDEFRLIHREKTDKPLIKNKRPVINELGKPEFLIKEFVPSFDFSGLPDYFYINNLNLKNEKNLLLYQDGLLKKLNQMGAIDVFSGDITPTGSPEQYKVSLNSKDRISVMKMFEEIRWCKKDTINGISKTIYPDVDIGNKHVLLQLNGINLTKDVISRGIEIFSNHFKIDLKSFFTMHEDAIIFHYRTKLEKVFNRGEAITDPLKLKKETIDMLVYKIKNLPGGEHLPSRKINYSLNKMFQTYMDLDDSDKKALFESTFNGLPYAKIKKDLELKESDYRPDMWIEWNNKIIQPMKDKYEETGVERIFLGELNDSNVTWDTQIYWPLTSSPHLLVAGQTRSGKTRSVLSLVATLKRAYPKSSYLFADGKSSVDYDLYAEKMSDYPVAKMSKTNDPLVELANIIMVAWNEYNDRRDKLSELKKKGISCTSYVQYNQHVEENEKLLRYFVVIDEFAEFAQTAPDTVESLCQIEGTIFYYLARMLRGAASVGLTFIIASQRVQRTDFPTPLRSNLTTWMIHSVNAGDAKYLDLVGKVETLGTGRYILQTPGLWCPDTSENSFVMAMPYIGDNEQSLIDLMELEDREHKEFNIDLLYNTGQDVNSKKMDIKTIYRYIKQAFIIREGYELIESHDPNYQYCSLVFQDKDKNKYAVVILDGTEISDEGIYEKLCSERDDFFTLNKLIFVIGKYKIANPEEFFDMGKVEVLNETDFTRPLKRAFEFNKNMDDTPVLGEILKRFHALPTPIVNDLYPEPEDKDINEAELNRIINIKSNITKGDAFEHWYLTLEKRLGYDTVSSNYLKENGFIPPSVFANGRAEGGLDLCRFIDRDNKEAIAIQLKNQSSKRLDTTVVDKMLKTKELYKSFGINFTKFLIVTTGKFTKQAREEADRCGINLIDGDDLRKMIKKHNSKK